MLQQYLDYYSPLVQNNTHTTYEIIDTKGKISRENDNHIQQYFPSKQNIFCKYCFGHESLLKTVSENVDRGITY